ncbi:hypothetical protein [Streptomyces viridochromogenes]|uniref:Putative Integral membrane protein n=1 Tax=Streptomyces viridochromogenes Tue57 TaxID=1160705 RepID=L8P8S7_STRVR|nr:hypothetical protein [Streptomyces viridochromogenes]ELS52825.1 putative Integral membrane protein [Streptomyces viridochromogenes Tue57]
MNAVLVVARHELRLLVSLVLWVARRRHQTGSGTAFGYARGQGPVMFGLAFVCVVESITMAVLLRDHPVVHRVVLLLDVYTIVLVVALHAASVVRPHVLDADSLRIRRAAHVDLRIPVEKIACVRRELRTAHQRAEGELDVVIGAQTSVTLELSEPVPYFGFLGRRRDIRLVRFHADDADALVRAVTTARSAPSPRPDRPG